VPAKIKKVKKQKEKREKTRKEKNKIWLILSILIIILLGILVGISFSKYQEKIIGKGFATIAKPVLEVRREQSLMVTALKPKAVYTFEVRNYAEEELNEIEMEYYIEILSATDESIEFKLYQGEKQISLVSNKTEKIKLAKEEKEIHSYRLEVIYDKTKNTTQEDIDTNVEIKIHSIQKA